MDPPSERKVKSGKANTEAFIFSNDPADTNTVGNMRALKPPSKTNRVNTEAHIFPNEPADINTGASEFPRKTGKANTEALIFPNEPADINTAGT